MANAMAIESPPRIKALRFDFTDKSRLFLLCIMVTKTVKITMPSGCSRAAHLNALTLTFSPNSAKKQMVVPYKV